jgi:hypothetical protein
VAVGADEHGGRVLGFYSLVLAPPELDLLFVADEAQGRRIGRLLVAHMQSEARADGLDRVKVVSDLPAEDFYHRAGVVPIGTALANPPAVPWTVPNSSFACLRNDAVCRFAGDPASLAWWPAWGAAGRHAFRVCRRLWPGGGNVCASGWGSGVRPIRGTSEAAARDDVSALCKAVRPT